MQYEKNLRKKIVTAAADDVIIADIIIGADIKANAHEFRYAVCIDFYNISSTRGACGIGSFVGVALLLLLLSSLAAV